MDTNKENNNSAPEKMEIEISRYKTLIEALGDPKKVVRLIIILSVVVIILACGIIGVVYGIKRFYPYKSINSNDYGATFIKDEDNEIIYWLFNTADLWANSGIEVKEGDVISVHTSGAFNPAIHHLVQDANRNNALRDPWVLSGGKGRLEFGPLYNQEAAREGFRIVNYAPFSAILMQVIPNKIANNMDRGWIREPSNAPYVDGNEEMGISPDIYVIGHGKESIRIRTSGVLHFAVNDVPLTQYRINKMEKLKETKDEFKDVKGVWYFIPNNKFESIFNHKEINKRIDSTKWFVEDTIREAKVGERIKKVISTEFWNKDYLRQIGIMDESLRFKSKYLNCEYLNYEYLNKKNEKLLKSYADSSIKYLGHIADSTIKYLGYKKDNKKIKLPKASVDSTIKYLEYIKDNKRKPDLPNVYVDSTIKYLGDFKDTQIMPKVSVDSTMKYLRYLIDYWKKPELPKAYDADRTTKKYLDYLHDTLGMIDTFWIPKENEYYKDRKFVDAWFVDNVGSFMIVIERKSDK